MITIRKLSELPPKTRLRRIVDQLAKLETEPPGKPVPKDYAGALLALIEGTLDRDSEERSAAASLAKRFAGVRRTLETLGDEERRILNEARHLVLRALGSEPSDWELAYRPADTRREKLSFPISLFIDGVRSPFNLGSIIRTAEAFGAQSVCVAPGGVDLGHRRVARAAMGAEKLIPCEVRAWDELSAADSRFALEQGGTDIGEFDFPPRGLVVIGSEEMGVSPDILSACDEEAGRVSIPLWGSKKSLNVGVAVGILLREWTNYIRREGYFNARSSSG